MYKIACLLTLLWGLSACSAPQSRPDPDAAAAAPAPSAAELEEVSEAQRRAMTFLNSSVFDRELAAAMRDGYRQIEVDVAGRFSLDVIPDRMEQWLAAVQDSEGLVQVQAMPDPDAPPVRSAELIALLQVAYSYFKDQSEDKGPDYRVSRDYHARLYYEQDSGIVRRLVFHRREAP